MWVRMSFWFTVCCVFHLLFTINHYKNAQNEILTPTSLPALSNSRPNPSVRRGVIRRKVWFYVVLLLVISFVYVFKVNTIVMIIITIVIYNTRHTDLSWLHIYSCAKCFGTITILYFDNVIVMEQIYVLLKICFCQFVVLLKKYHFICRLFHYFSMQCEAQFNMFL